MTLKRIGQLSWRPTEIAGSLALPLLLLTVFSGCRTYGGYGTEVKTVETIEEANEQFARSLSRAEGDLLTLRGAAATDARLTSLTEEFGRIVSDHDSLLEVHRDAYAGLGGRSGYRASSRLLGSIVTDHHRIADRYLAAAERAAALVGRVPSPLRTPALYQQVPPYYLRVEAGVREPKLSDIIRPGA